MYCNPSVAADTDTSELKKTFRAPPKSDGKIFNTFTLFELIRKLEEKEIKTWAQLAIDLGVEPPALDKGQSAQKVQQYAVRLKRWMHAMHVDAFFEYLLNKPHVYWTQVPSASDPTSDTGRDGVPAEEDLALRALLPETRPKRGRRKAEEREDDIDSAKTPSQRRRIDSPDISDEFMLGNTPVSAQPNFNHSFNDGVVPWSTTDAKAPRSMDNFRWTHPDEAQTPMSAYPRSAITPSTRMDMWNDGSRSAITPNKTRNRRKHGPAVSSAWPSNGSSSTGKFRGRPPTNRNTLDGPFSTFPANPASRDVPTISLQDSQSTSIPTVERSNVPHFFPPNMNIPQAPPSSHPTQNGRPSHLSLQVPEREGGSVRLATPPPVVLVNGQENTEQPHINDIQPPQNFTPMMEYFTAPGTFQNFVDITFRQTPTFDRTNVDALESHFISEILAADWFSPSNLPIERCNIGEASKICKQVIKNLQAESSSTEAFLINLSALAGGPLMTRLRMTRNEVQGRTDYECHWRMRFGSIGGDFTIRATVAAENSNVGMCQEMGDPVDGEETWKRRYLDLQQQIRERDQKVVRLKRSIVDALSATNSWGPV
ncbi:ARS binding protein 2-domain-containing protein [Calycina marina]|uniref:ARS binding protein 2-domain-containing protein n=1 Tax=Calycina marina TaxID=1763456 RepID=A0A9P7Z3G5_9HELO|nr:ARS binding protein 2-domain-containing protein [Calycina marina]